MIVDCDGCVVRGVACEGCSVNALFQIDSAVSRLGPAEVAVLEIFARQGFEVSVIEEPAPGRARARRGRRSRHAA